MKSEEGYAMVQDEKEVPLPEGVVIDESKVQAESEFTAGNGDSENSLLSVIGKAITPIFEPFGVESNNWPASVSLFTGLLAKEAVIGTMNSLYSMAGPGDAAEVASRHPEQSEGSSEVSAEQNLETENK